VLIVAQIRAAHNNHARQKARRERRAEERVAMMPLVLRPGKGDALAPIKYQLNPSTI
jgi:hypothetical protein